MLVVQLTLGGIRDAVRAADLHQEFLSAGAVEEVLEPGRSGQRTSAVGSGHVGGLWSTVLTVRSRTTQLAGALKAFAFATHPHGCR